MFRKLCRKEEHKMTYFSQITTPQEELNYLKKINDLNTQLHEKYSNRFFSDHNIQRKYETMFKPITKPLRKSITQQEQFHTSLTRKEQQQQEQQQEQQQQQEQYGGPGFSTPLQKRRKAIVVPAGKKRKVSTSIRKASPSSTGGKKKKQKTKRPLFPVTEESEGEEEGEFHIAQFIKHPEKYGFPDRFFGITKKSGKAYDKYMFLGSTVQILGNPSDKMKIIAPAHLQQTLDIPSQNLWEIIVLEQPSHAISHTESVQYGNILIANDFEAWLHTKRHSKSKQDMLSSPKFQNIIQTALHDAKNAQQHPGSGMYTFHSPRYYLNRTKGRGLKKKKKEKKNSSVEFFPANKKVLLKKLIYLLGEFQCGNTYLRNEIIPIVNYLKSQKALPAKFDTRRMNWIYD